eukprot:1323605-Prymnesium_polylepis.1
MIASVNGSSTCPEDKTSLPDGVCGCTAGFFYWEERCRPCPTWTSSVDGAVGMDSCDICNKGFFRLTAHDVADDNGCLSCIDGAICTLNATRASLVLKQGYWRPSPLTKTLLECQEAGNWNPCRGGNDTGHEGDGYCVWPHSGP